MARTCAAQGCLDDAVIRGLCKDHNDRQEAIDRKTETRGGGVTIKAGLAGHAARS